ncbi:MAG: hypothetical protein H5T97_10805, partial [Firmicutes bacterium]|nr:hypothetical protein [Bacillota bacterium]
MDVRLCGLRGRLAALARDQRGSALVLVAAATAVLFGFGALVLDYGSLVTVRARLNNATDAAALAGTEEYALTGDWGRTTAVAEQYLLANADPDGWRYSGEVGVEAWREVPFTFARVLGLRSATVRVRSQAVSYAASAVYGAAPLAVRDREYAYGELVDL